MKLQSQLLAKLTSGKKLEWLAFAVYVVAFCVISAFHEPWFDEAQAWQIARSASISDILFVLPHFEGHPPLWHLILAIPAKLGVPYEVGLKTTGALFSFIAAYLMFFKSMLPRPARLVLPFTYFFFYQFGVITRPYTLMLIMVLLLGMNLGQRAEHPWRITLLLGGLCLTGIYGMLIAGGIALCMTWEILREKGFGSLLRELVRDSRTASLLALLILAIVLGVEVWPSDQAYAVNISVGTPFALRLLCSTLVLPLECLLTTSSWFNTEQVAIQFAQLYPAEVAIMCVVGTAMWCLIICSSSKKGLKYLLVPYALFAVFSASVYLTTHHIGVAFLQLLMFAEMMSRDAHRFEIGQALVDRFSRTERDEVLARRAYMIIASACIVVPLYWSIAAAVLEIQTQYGFATAMASFIKEHQLENRAVFASWSDQGSLFAGAEGHEDYINVEISGIAPPLLAYFDHNFIVNFHLGSDQDMYVLHRTASYEESQAVVEAWREAGAPDVILGRPDLSLVFGNDVSYDDYTCVSLYRSGNIWKAQAGTSTALIYIRNDLVDQYGLEPVDDSSIRMLMDGLEIPQEVLDSIRNGAEPEEALDPYLDQIFGEN